MKELKTVWRGDQVAAKMENAARWGIDRTMAEAVVDAKQNHKGWNNITGLAEGSVRIVKAAKRSGNGTVGFWGSTGVDYVIWLEVKQGAFLRTAGDKAHKNLAGHIAAKMK